MDPALIAIAAGVLIFVGLAAVSLRGVGRKRRRSDGGPMVPMGTIHSDDAGGDVDA